MHTTHDCTVFCSGVLVQLRYQYPRGVSEPAIYLEANVISDADNVGVDLQEKQKAVAKSNKPSKLLNSLDFSVSHESSSKCTIFNMVVCV